MSEEDFDLGYVAPLDGRYSNYFEVGCNAFEVLLKFGQFYADATKPRHHTKIIMSPYYAKGLLETLQESLEQYERSYGVIVGPKTEAQAVPEVANTASESSTGFRFWPLIFWSSTEVVSNMPPKTANQIDDAIQAMLQTLKAYVSPAGDPNFPVASVSVSTVNERAVGLSNRRGEEERVGFGVVDLKGGRFDAVVRFELWAGKLPDVELAVQDLIRRLLADRDHLWTAGFLRVALQSISFSENVAALNAWRQTADLRVLYEYHIVDTDNAQGLIARIPIHIDTEYKETTTVTDDMVRWDHRNAPRLVVRGPMSVTAMSCLFFATGQPPASGVSLIRTFDGATGAPKIHPDLVSFVAAVGGAEPSERHSVVAFNSWNNFIAVFARAGNPVELGGNPYSSLRVVFDQNIYLNEVGDRLEVAYQKPAFEVNAVAYLRAL